MNYKFPKILDRESFWKVVNNLPEEFFLAHRIFDGDRVMVLNYNVAFEDTFPPVDSYETALLREFRGLMFKEYIEDDGERIVVVSRPYHKFFNVNEKEETQINNIDFDKPHHILEKLDGSMIRTMVSNKGNVIYMSKMGETDVADAAKKWVKENAPHYEDCIKAVGGLTFIFEFCSADPKHRIVVNHPETRLVLTAIRENTSGMYMNYPLMLEIANMCGIHVVKAFPGNINSMEHLVETTRNQDEGEGWVVRFRDGHMIKVKADWYVRVHKTKELLQYEKHIVDLIVNNEIDDLVGILPDEDIDRIRQFEKNFESELHRISEEYLVAAKEVYASMTRKDFGLNKDKYEKQLGSAFPKIVFKFWDDHNFEEFHNPFYDVLLDMIRNSLTSNAKWDMMKQSGIKMKVYWE